METITFESNRTKVILNSQIRPTILIIRAKYSPKTKNWVDRLSGSMLEIKIEGKRDGNLITSTSDKASIGSLISPYHKEPIVEIDKHFRPMQIIQDQFNQTQMDWAIEVSLINMELSDGETLEVEFMDSNHISRRVIDWQERINNLIKNIRDWLEGVNGLDIRYSRKIKMLESLMESFGVEAIDLDTAEITKNGRVIVLLKPKGLWVIGANGRIDLLTKKGLYILVDKANAFESPIWKLHRKDNRKESIDFNKEALLNLL